MTEKLEVGGNMTSLLQCEYSYLLTLPYGGKPEEISDEYGKYYVTGTDKYSIYLVEELSKINSVLGCNISMDGYFTSVPLTRWATEHKISIVGTMRLDRKGIPKEFRSTDNHEEKSTTFMDKMLVMRT